MMAALPSTTRQWALRQKPGAERVSPAHFVFLKDVPLPETNREGKVLVKVLYLSNDPGQRKWMDSGEYNQRPYIPPVMYEGSKVFSWAVGEVLHSYSPDFSTGDLVFGHLGWTEFDLVDPKQGIPLQKISQGVEPADYICCDLTGQSAYFGFFRRGKAHSNMKTVVVSSAAGGVGSMVTQFAKNILGIERVVGICGSDEKCALIKEKCGVDIALNYKSPSFAAEFADATPEYIDLYFDNVGGVVLDLAVQRIAKFGRIVSCGAISHIQREQETVVSPVNWMQLINQHATIAGFLIVPYFAECAEASKIVLGWAREGKLQLLRTVDEVRFEQVPAVFCSMFGENPAVGKHITKISH